MSTTFPPCFGSQTAFDIYEEQVREAPEDGVQSYCHHCTPAYQAQMLRRNECLHPETVFVPIVDEDGESCLVGVRGA